MIVLISGHGILLFILISEVSMKSVSAVIMCLLLVLSIGFTGAEPARFLKQDNNNIYHSEHLRLHLTSRNCKVSGNYIKVRTEPGGSKVLGHLEMADTFTLDDVSDHWVKITVVRASKTSPDSWIGLSGWVDATYVECPCSSDEYYANTPSLTYSLAVCKQNKTNLREEPSKASTSFDKLLQGAQVEVLSEYTGKDNRLWYRVRSEKGIMGFIRSDLLEITDVGLPELLSGQSGSEDILVSLEKLAVPADTPVNAPSINTSEHATAMLITPDQSLPSPEEASGNSAGWTTGPGNEEIGSLSLANEDMRIALVNKPAYLCFEIESYDGSAIPINLVRLDTGAIIGEMLDDGTQGDQIDGDGIYSLGITVIGSDYGRVRYAAEQNGRMSNDIIIHFYNPDRALNEHYIIELQEAQRSIESSPGNVFSEIIHFVKTQYLQGNVSEFIIEDGTIQYSEMRTSYPLYYVSSEAKATAFLPGPTEEPLTQEEKELADWQLSYQELMYGNDPVSNP